MILNWQQLTINTQNKSDISTAFIRKFEIAINQITMQSTSLFPIRKHYLYRHIRLDKNEPFYIGVGTKPIDYDGYYTEFKRAFSKQRNGFWKIIAEKSEYSVEILIESDSIDFIFDKEIEFIKLYGRKDIGTGILVNLSDGGKNCPHKWSRESRKKASLSRFGKKPSRDSVEKTRIANTGRKITLEQSKKRSDNHFTKKHGYVSKLIGRKLPPERVAKIALAKKGQRCSIQTEFKNKPIIQLSQFGEILKEFTGAQEAALELECSVGMITHAVKGRTPKAKGFYWCYKGDEIEKQKSIIDYNNSQIDSIHVYFGKEYLGEYVNRFIAAQTFGLRSSSINNCLIGKMYQTNGYSFKRVN